MLRVHVWDDVGGEWNRSELDLPHVCRDPQVISNAIDRANGERADEDDPAWRVTDSVRCGPLLVAVSRSERGAWSILLVNENEQDSAYRCPECESEQAVHSYFHSGLPGVIAHVENGTFEKAERCDTRMRFATDEEASRALSDWLSRKEGATY